MLPIGLRLRKKLKAEAAPEAKSKVSLLSLDEQIALLQQKNEQSASDSGSDSSNASDGRDESDSNASDSEEEVVSGVCKVVRDKEGNIVKIVSSIDEEERIKPLPAQYLPAARCNTSNALEEKDGKTRKRKIRFVEEPTPEQVAISGMEKTVREMLSHYEPVSQDRKPFYCRVCSHQASSLEDFEAHKKTEFHAVAVRLERSRSYCKHCEKQFTSPDQLRGHVEGKAHKERVARMAARKRGNYGANAAAIQYS